METEIQGHGVHQEYSGDRNATPLGLQEWKCETWVLSNPQEGASQGLGQEGRPRKLSLELSMICQDYNGLLTVPSVTARVACSGTRLGSVRMLVEALSWRREFRTAEERQRHLLGPG